jgi:CubicO group peptidase (beta-lactamase class C family)
LILAILGLGTIASGLPAQGGGLADLDPEARGFHAGKLHAIDELVEDAIHDGGIPGAVVLVGRKGAIVYAKPFGDRAVEPSREPMTRDTIFDLASLTKPVATATSILILRDRGALKLDDTLSKVLPEFDNHGKGAITIEQLLRHRAGFIPDNALSDFADGPEKAWERLANLDLRSPPGSKFSYSDVGFMTLGRVVERVSGKPLAVFAEENIFHPLGMTDTQFPGRGDSTPEQLIRTAPTEQVDGAYLLGVVHDPRARALGGVAGHAGLFSTADDLAIFADMLLSGGKRDGQVILQPETVVALSDPATTPEGERRGLGWDVDTGFTALRGTGFSRRGFGHTGFTGTSLWIDRDTETFVILLTSRLHPRGTSGSTGRLRGAVATAVAHALELAD